MLEVDFGVLPGYPGISEGPHIIFEENDLKTIQENPQIMEKLVSTLHEDLHIIVEYQSGVVVKFDPYSFAQEDKMRNLLRDLGCIKSITGYIGS